MFAKDTRGNDVDGDAIISNAERHGWSLNREPCGAQRCIVWRLTSPLGEVHECGSLIDVHYVLTSAKFRAWDLHRACEALQAIAEDRLHADHLSLIAWLSDPEHIFDPWSLLGPDVTDPVVARRSLPPELIGRLCVNGDDGGDLRPAMRHFLAAESANRLSAELPIACPAPCRTRL